MDTNQQLLTLPQRAAMVWKEPNLWIRNFRCERARHEFCAHARLLLLQCSRGTSHLCRTQRNRVHQFTSYGTKLWPAWSESMIVLAQEVL